MDIILAVIGTIGSVLTIVLFVASQQTRRQKLIHISYCTVIAAFVSLAVWYSNAYRRVQRVERAATALLAHAEMDYTDSGFIQAALAFLEKNKDLYPDSYARAIELCKQHQCLEAEYGNKSVDQLTYGNNQIELKFALEGLIRGISSLESTS